MIGHFAKIPLQFTHPLLSRFETVSTIWQS